MQQYQPVEDDVANEMNLMGVEESEESGDGIFDEDKMEKPQSKNKKPMDIVRKFVFYDIETTQNRVFKTTKIGDHLLHEPNVCVAMVVCNDCYNKDVSITPCGRCGPRKYVFTGEGCVTEFCKFLISTKMNHAVAIAHNARGFDANFIFQYIYQQGLRPKKVISNGKYKIL